MLTDLKFVMGAVAKKDLVPAMSHFNITDGFVRSYNGIVALCAPIAFDINCNPKAEQLYRAVENCDEAVTLNLTPTGKLSVKSGRFRALVPCIEETIDHPMPEGDIAELDGATLLKALTVLAPVIGDDAARPWQAGVLLKDGCAHVTCNVVAVQYWLGGMDFKHVVNIPEQAVREILRVKEVPTHAQVSDNSITFHYESGRWIRSQLLPNDWPDFNHLLAGCDKANHREIEPAMWEACDKLKKFVDMKMGEAIYFEGGEAFTHRNREEGSSFLCESIRWTGIFNRSMLMLLQPLAQKADFSTWPRPCYFAGENLRGAIIGRAA